MLPGEMQALSKAILLAFLFSLTGCAANNDNAHTTATTIVPPPPRQQLQISTRPATETIREDPYDANFNSQKPQLFFHLPDGKTFRENEPVVINFSLAHAKLKGDGGDYRVRYIVDDEEMRWIDRWEEVVLTGWTPGKHTIRLELVGPNGWPVDQGVAVRELTITK